eukprot:TRINITY_DN6469_c0_g1_i2.p1 TRINITY_DN6469_c0_g1~~TRINITY_DN6469_c0_g1_i2.p1  ORF type:complete len:693 (+),score=170.43 TRINITY_DN6469_c0_g1_i2:77-2155(+)
MGVGFSGGASAASADADKRNAHTEVVVVKRGSSILEGGEPYDKALFMATHKSSHIEMPPIRSLLSMGFRGFELDISVDTESKKIVLYGDQINIEGNKEDVKGKDLDEWLRIFSNWSKSHSAHTPITIYLNCKDNIADEYPGGYPAFNSFVKNIFQEKLFTPDELLKKFKGAWPKLFKMEGKVLIVVTGCQPARTWYRRDSGRAPCVSVNSSGHIVEIHESEGKFVIWIGLHQEKSISWIKRDSLPLQGKNPSVAINDKGNVVLVFTDTEGALTSVFGKLEMENEPNIKWNAPVQFDTGIFPSVALNNFGIVVEVHKSSPDEFLTCRVASVSDGELIWQDKQYDDSKSTISIDVESLPGDGYGPTVQFSSLNSSEVVERHFSSRVIPSPIRGVGGRERTDSLHSVHSGNRSHSPSPSPSLPAGSVSSPLLQQQAPSTPIPININNPNEQKKGMDPSPLFSVISAVAGTKSRSSSVSVNNTAMSPSRGDLQVLLELRGTVRISANNPALRPGSGSSMSSMSSSGKPSTANSAPAAPTANGVQAKSLAKVSWLTPVVLNSNLPASKPFKAFSTAGTQPQYNVQVKADKGCYDTDPVSLFYCIPGSPESWLPLIQDQVCFVETTSIDDGGLWHDNEVRFSGCSSRNADFATLSLVNGKIVRMWKFNSASCKKSSVNPNFPRYFVIFLFLFSDIFLS